MLDVMTTRIVIAHTPAGLPRTYRLVRPGRAPAVIVLLKKLLAA
jgi:hypothetical protein